MPVTGNIAARLRKLEAAHRVATVEERPSVVIYAVGEPTAGPDGMPFVTGDPDAAVSEARTALPRQRPAYALPDNHRGDGPRVWGSRPHT